MAQLGRTMTLRRSSAARQDRDVPATHAGDQTLAGGTGDPPAGYHTSLPPHRHPAPAPGGGPPAAHWNVRTCTHRTSGHPASECPDMTPDAGGPADSLTPVQKILRARLAAMSAPRLSDDPETVRLRSLLRDWEAMAEVTATVDQWQPITEEQRETLAALLHPYRDRRRRAAG